MDMDMVVEEDLSPVIKIYKSGRPERLVGTTVIPASVDESTGVVSSDIIICKNTPLSARLYVPPKKNDNDHDLLLPLVVYFHGGGFLIESASSPTYHNYLNALAAQAPAVVLSVDYRLAPENPLPAAYDDAMAALRWLFSAFSKADQALSRADPTRIYLAGDSAGGNIAHHAAILAATEENMSITGAILVHPYFMGSDDPVKIELVEKMWRLAKPDSTLGLDDPWINPETDPADLGRLRCGRVLVCLAETDFLSQKGLRYADALRRSDWGGTVEVFETKGEGHVFHLQNPTCDNASDLMLKICGFIGA